MKNKKHRGYTVTVAHKDETILQRKFMFLSSAETWACEVVRTILVCDCPATIASNTTGEIMMIISR